MPETIGLPSGGSVTLRDAEDFTYGDIRRMRETVAGDGGYDNLAVAALRLRDEVAKALVTAWDLPYLPDAGLPKDDPAVFDRLKPRDADKILDAAREVQDVLFPRAATPDDSDKPGSPTGPTDG